jgi:hypothetical protein
LARLGQCLAGFVAIRTGGQAIKDHVEFPVLFG